MHSLSGTATLHDAAVKLHGRAWADASTVNGLTALTPRTFVSGPAYTLRITRAPQASTAQREAFYDALELSEPGSIVVIEDSTGLTGAMVGDVVLHALEQAGVVGFVTNARMRDLTAYAQQTIGVWAGGSAMGALDKASIITETNVPLFIGGTCIRPEAILCADDDGIISIASGEIEEIRIAGITIDVASAQMRDAISGGASLQEARRRFSTHRH